MAVQIANLLSTIYRVLFYGHKDCTQVQYLDSTPKCKEEAVVLSNLP